LKASLFQPSDDIRACTNQCRASPADCDQKKNVGLLLENLEELPDGAREIDVPHPRELVLRLGALGVEHGLELFADLHDAVDLAAIEPNPAARAAAIDLDVLVLVFHVLDEHERLAERAMELAVSDRSAGLRAIPVGRIGLDAAGGEHLACIEELATAL